MNGFIEFLLWVKNLGTPEGLKTLAAPWGYAWVGYAVLFAIIFSETGLLLGFCLPGDSLLFAAGLLASQDVFNLFLLLTLLSTAAILGDSVNYALGAQAGANIFERGRLKFIKQEHLLSAKAFYEKHGGKAIILARFVPLVRTFTPFIAGVARMNYWEFAIYNVVGGIGWVVSMTLAGYFLGNIPLIRDNFEITVVVIVLLSVSPIVFAGLKKWRSSTRASAAPLSDKSPAA